MVDGPQLFVVWPNVINCRGNCGPAFERDGMFPTECSLAAQNVRALAWAYEQLFHNNGGGDERLGELALVMMSCMDRMMADVEDGVAAMELRQSQAMQRRTGT